jgi:predicted GIY-YIG superfamily endonuclease
MHFAYILKSLKDGTYYKGSCSKPVEERLAEHNRGKERYTKAKRPWVVHYTESFKTRSEARKREAFFKSPKGWGWLKDNNII